ncbi:MAG: M3 family metallopeptidase [Sphingomicrobium sp.]
MASLNLLLARWLCPEGSPDFAAFKTENFLPAFGIAIDESRLEIGAITADDRPADFDNTLLALERSGETLARVKRIFWLLSSTQSDDQLRAIESSVSAMLAAFGTEISHDPALFARVRKVWNERDKLNPEQQRLVERSYNGFLSSGAALNAAAQQRLGDILLRLSALSVKFGQNVLAATNFCEITLDRSQLGGIPADMVEAAAQKQSTNRSIFVLDRGVFEALLTFADDRGVREQTWRAFTSRCQSGEYDNLPIIAEIMTLRQEQAALLGYATFADYALEESMARTPTAAGALLQRLLTPAIEQALEERARLEALAGHEIEAWDWRYFADRVRRKAYAYDAAAIRAHLSLGKVRSAAFDAAGRLYGLTFHRRDDVPVYHPDVHAWSVADRDGSPLGLLFTDYLARPEKYGGAWMGSLRVQEKMDGPVRPIVYTVANIPAPPNTGSRDDSGALLSLDEARTLFHEFGHALHALLSNVTYPSLAGTSVARDFVEFPSKLMEHWVVAPEALRGFGIADELVEAIGRADSFGQGFSTVELLASALVDLELHQSARPPLDIARFEQETLRRLEIPSAIGMRHKLAYFTHVFDGGYASAYYSYLWSEVLDADVFEAFEAAGDLFDTDLAARLRREVLSAGDSRDPMASFIAFRGRQPDESALIRSRCLA